MAKSNINYIDWWSILAFIVLSIFGWINIYSASYNDDAPSFFAFSEPYGKQGIWLLLCIVIGFTIIILEKKFFERFSSLIYIISMLSLLGLMAFGKTISGATSWYVFGPLSIQPSEFAKAATGLALAKFISDIQTNIKKIKDQLRAFLIILTPIALIMLQPDAGSAIVFAAYLFPLFREGITSSYIYVLFVSVVIFIATLLIGPHYVLLSLFIIGLTYILTKKGKYILPVIVIFTLITAYSYSTDYIFYNVFKQHHRDRINLVLGKEVDAKGIGYNTNQSEIAIGSGGWLGKGWTQGTQTKGGFVPEQHTDYIFSTVGEEWGFLGSFLTIVVFSFLMIRVLILAERQKSQFNRVYGYSVAGVLFIHFFVNIGMVIGLLPTVGIPLPFFSYGGSGLWGFAILLFILIKLDSERMSV